MKETFYFQHDYNPTSDPKIVCLLGNYGGLGYGVFWRIIEMLHQEENHKLPKKLYIFEAIAKQMLTDANKIEEIINDCIEKYELLKCDDDYFWSSRVDTNIEKREEKKEKKSIAGKKGMKSRWHSNNNDIEDDNNVITKDNSTITNITKESKVKESKVKESKVKESKVKETKVNNNLPAKADGVNKIFEIFYEINPSINYGNKTSRASAKWLIDKMGQEKAENTAKYAISLHGTKYAPTITTPYMLKEKLSELMAYYKKQNNQDKKIQSL